MNILDKVIAAVTPPESKEARAEARDKARTAGLGRPLAGASAEAPSRNRRRVRRSRGRRQRRDATTGSTLDWRDLTGHSIAEEAVIYPAIALTDQKGHSTAAYTEQSAAKVQMAALEDLDPMSQDFLDKLEHIRGAVVHHIYEEEGTWFVNLSHSADAALQAKLTARYGEEFERYLGEIRQ